MIMSPLEIMETCRNIWLLISARLQSLFTTTTRNTIRSADSVTMYYGLTRLEQLYQMAEDVCDLFPGSDREATFCLMIETAQKETKCGRFRDPTPDGAGRGITQIDPVGLNDTVNRTRNARIEQVRQRFGIDLYQVEHDDLDYSPLVCLLITRLKYMLIPDAIPSTVDGRAEYWKKWYNSSVGKGTAEQYIADASALTEWAG